MAYNKNFNPDALPAHAEPDQAAQALSTLSLSPQPASQTGQAPNPRLSPAALAAQQSYRPHGAQPNAYYRQNQQTQQQQPHQQHQQPHQYGYPSQSHSPNPRPVLSPPPPADYGHGPRPRPPQGHQRPPPQVFANTSHPLPAPGPDEDLHPLFRAANVSGTGYLTTSELGSVLVNVPDSTPFDSRTIRSLMRMFSKSDPLLPQGPTIGFNEFQNLWKFLAAWRELFERFDEDGSGKISLAEFSNSLVAFGYRLSQPFVGLLYSTYNDRPVNERRGSRGNTPGMSFDLFVQACVSLKRMTDVFKKYDDDMDGYVMVSFEEFLTEILKLRDP